MDKFLQKREKGFTRALEFLPGTLAWGIILFPAVGGLFAPQLVAYFLMVFVVYWLFKSFKSAFFSTIGYFLVKDWEKMKWFKKWESDIAKEKLDWNKIKHVVIVPNVDESIEVLSRSLNGFANQKQIDMKNMFVFLAMEARVKDSKERAKKLLKKYDGKFGMLVDTYHPANLPGEIIGKAANEAWAAKGAKKILDNKKIDLKYVTVTSCDADARFHPNYFAALTYSFAVNENRYLRFWQSPIFWYNNIHRVPFPIKMLGVIGHAIHLSDLQEPSRLIFNYSCYSLSFKLLYDVGYWHPDIIPEDWHLFLQTFFEKQGKVDVEAIFLPTHIDAPEAKTWFGSLMNRYHQCKRHAWGASDIPYAIKESIKHKEIPLTARIMRVYKMIETHVVWSTNWFVLTMGATLPVLLNPAFARTALGHNLPKMAEAVLRVSLLALVVMVIIDIALRPNKAKPDSALKIVKEAIQWATLPFITLPLAVLPGLHAQTMLLFGKRLEYKTTEKV